MNIDRENIVQIISKMLDNPNEHEIYPTSTAYGELELLCESIRMEMLGWAYAYSCSLLDKGEDIRLIDVPKIIDDYRSDIEKL